MISKFRILLDDFVVHWRHGVITFILVASILAAGLLLRAPFQLMATVEIGGITFKNDGKVKFQAYESANEIETFYEYYFSDNKSMDFSLPCAVKAIYSPDGQRIKVTCRGASENGVRDAVAMMLEPLMRRHQDFYEHAKDYYDSDLKELENQVDDKSAMIKALRKSPLTGIVEAEIIGIESDIKYIQNKIKRSKNGVLISQTLLDQSNIQVLNRQPGLKVWVVVLLLSLGSGLFVAAFSARLKRIEA